VPLARVILFEASGQPLSLLKCGAGTGARSWLDGAVMAYESSHPQTNK